MNTKQFTVVALVLGLAGLIQQAAAQGTAFTYQGRLNDTNGLVSGLYDLRFRVFPAAAGGAQVGITVTSNAVPVTEGLFAIRLDFGTSVFTGPDRWLEVAVKTNLAATLNTLSPRQPLTPSPYAIYAADASRVASGGVGTLALQNGSVTLPKLASGVMHPSNFPPNSVTSLQLADSIELGATNVSGQLDLYRTSVSTPSIRLFGGSSQISTYGGDGLEQIRLWGTGWGELLLHNSLSNNAVTAFLSAGGGSGGFLQLTSSDGPTRAQLTGANAGGVLNLYDDASANRVRLHSDGLSWLNGGNVGIGTTSPQDSLLDIEGHTHINDFDIFLRGGSDRNHGIGYRADASGIGIDGPFVFGWNGGALGVSSPDSVALKWDFNGNIWVSNDISAKTISIRGGADLAEPFQMPRHIVKGALVIIDEENPGRLKLSEKAFDQRVAGIVSGANGVNPGITLQQEGLLEGGQNVALSGRVYALADASPSPIKPGDLLTSSGTPGHVMKVTTYAKAQGAIVGKAMSALPEGKGMVLVLVSLQ